MDDVDRAQEINEAHLADSLAAYRAAGNRLSTQRAARSTCIDCDEDIPEARRKAMPGCTRCVDCQEMLEHWRPL